MVKECVERRRVVFCVARQTTDGGHRGVGAGNFFLA